MLNNSEIILLTVLRQREALYQTHNEFDITRTDLEVLGFAKKKRFFTLYDLQEFYKHTNIQQIRRSLKDLTGKNFVQIFSRNPNTKKINYTISNKGKHVYNQYAAIILDESYVLSIKTV